MRVEKRRRRRRTLIGLEKSKPFFWFILLLCGGVYQIFLFFPFFLDVSHIGLPPIPYRLKKKFFLEDLNLFHLFIFLLTECYIDLACIIMMMIDL